ncbi:hypothetical protein GUH88_07115, partial [Xanthomonas citri pv. citri]|nr:hypothetical protein [Xanthomonas citri pv. citri]
SKKGNQNGATYKKEIVLEFLANYPKASTMAISRMIFEKHSLDFSSVDAVRSNVRRYRGENGINNSQVTRVAERSEETKKQFMSKKIDLP